jgi:hypothetical protein
MAMLDAAKITIDASDAIRIVKQMQLKLAESMREIPHVVSADGTKWADVTALIDLADKWERDASA